YGHSVGVCQIVGGKGNRAGVGLRSFINGLTQFRALFASDGQDAMAGFRQSASDAQPDTSASAGHDDVTHDCGPTFRLLRWPRLEQSESSSAPYAAPAIAGSMT